MPKRGRTPVRDEREDDFFVPEKENHTDRRERMPRLNGVVKAVTLVEPDDEVDRSSSSGNQSSKRFRLDNGG